MLVAFSVAPAGGSSSDSVHDAVAAAVRVVRDSGLPNRTDAMFTTIEGDWDECMAVVRGAVEAVEAYGTRVSLVLKADIRPGHTGELTGKLDRLEAAIARSAAVAGVDVHGDVVDPDLVDEAAAEPAEFASPQETEADEAAPEVGSAAIADEATPGVADAQPAAAARPATVICRFVVGDRVVSVLGSGDDDMHVRCAADARVMVADAAPPEQLGLIPLSRARLRTEDGVVRVLSGAEEAWRGDAGASVSVVVWADDVEDPAGLWVELVR